MTVNSLSRSTCCFLEQKEYPQPNKQKQKVIREHHIFSKCLLGQRCKVPIQIWGKWRREIYWHPMLNSKQPSRTLWLTRRHVNWVLTDLYMQSRLTKGGRIQTLNDNHQWIKVQGKVSEHYEGTTHLENTQLQIWDFTQISYFRFEPELIIQEGREQEERNQRQEM